MNQCPHKRMTCTYADILYWPTQSCYIITGHRTLWLSEMISKIHQYETTVPLRTTFEHTKLLWTMIHYCKPSFNPMKSWLSVMNESWPFSYAQKSFGFSVRRSQVEGIKNPLKHKKGGWLFEEFLVGAPGQVDGDMAATGRLVGCQSWVENHWWSNWSSQVICECSQVAQHQRW